MRATIVLIGLLFVAPALAEEPAAPVPVPPAPQVTYTLTTEQRTILRRALMAADFWLKVRTAAAANSLEGHGFELAQQELAALAAELARQDQAPK